MIPTPPKMNFERPWASKLSKPRTHYSRTSIGNSVDRASMKILKESFESAANKNVIASPLGALTLLAMVSAGTDDESRDEIMGLLNAIDYKELEESYSILTKRFSTMDPSYLAFANTVYVSDKLTLKEHFSKVVSESYQSEVEQVDFDNKRSTVSSINKWANKKTKGLISSPVNEDMIDQNTAAALFNVIFFKGQWHFLFESKHTIQKDFYVNNTTTVKKPMMHQTSSLKYHEDDELRAKMIEIPYKEDGFRMVIGLPTEREGLREVVDKLSQRGLLDYVFQLQPIGKVALEMPKFEIKSSLNLNNILPKVGVSKIFSEGANGIVNESAVKISRAFQEAVVKVDEKGVTAAAFTGCFTLTKSLRPDPPPPLPFKVDHPFLFAIIYEDILVFTGTFTK